MFVEMLFVGDVVVVGEKMAHRGDAGEEMLAVVEKVVRRCWRLWRRW